MINYFAKSEDVIELAKDYTKMCSEIDHLFLLAVTLKNGEDYTWILDKSKNYDKIKHIAEQIRELYAENKNLKEELASLKKDNSIL